MSEDNFDWTEYANNPDDGATIINLIKENESLKSELEQLKKELNLAKKVRSHLDQICDGTHEEVSCLIQIENEKLKKENLAMRNCVNCKYYSMNEKCLHPNRPATLNCRCNLWVTK